MSHSRSSAALRTSRAATAPDEEPLIGGKIPEERRRYLIALGVISIIVVGLVVIGFGAFNSPSPATASLSSTSSTTSTFYAVDAVVVITSSGVHAPSGYAEGLSKLLKPNETGLANGGYALFTNQGAALANMTILVFNSTGSAQTYVNSVIANSKDLSGYSDITISLASFQHYGTCYGFGQTDPAGAGSVATGVCTKGNVYIQVHVASNSSLQSAEEDMSGLVGAAYQSTG